MLTPEQLATLRNELASPAYSGTTDAEAADILNAIPMVPNPSPQPARPREVRATEILAMLSPTTVGKIAGLGLLGHLDSLAWNQERERIRTWVDSFLVPTGNCEVSEAAAVAGYLDSVEPDPFWPPEVRGQSRWRALFGEQPVEWVEQRDGFDFHRTAIGYCLPEFVAEARQP